MRVEGRREKRAYDRAVAERIEKCVNAAKDLLQEGGCRWEDIPVTFEVREGGLLPGGWRVETWGAMGSEGGVHVVATLDIMIELEFTRPERAAIDAAISYFEVRWAEEVAQG